jgi:transketolase
MGNDLFIKRAYSVKRRFLGMYRAAHAGHIACGLSCADLLVFLKFHWMGEKDSLILSKGHAAAALYSLLAEAGELPEEEISTFYRDGTLLGAHPPIGQIKGIPFATGSLGHGLPIASGMAYAAGLKGDNRTVFCVTSDGELDEGSIWESALFMAQHRQDNVVWLIDRNKLQGFGRTEEVIGLEPLDLKLKSFGLFVAEADGHDFVPLQRAKDLCLNSDEAENKPKVMICNTVKGHGVSFMENQIAWHYLPMDGGQYDLALKELKDRYEKDLKGQ